MKEELCCVAFYGNRTIATDSFRLLEVEAKRDQEGNLPAAHEPKLLHADVVKKLKLKKADAVSLTDLEQQADVPANLHLPYPDVDAIIHRAEKEEEYTEVRINGRLLGELLIAMSKGNAYGQVTLRVPTTPYKPVYAFTVHGEQKMRGMCMPMNR